MTDYEAIKEAPLANLDFFTMWGAKPWQKFIEIAIKAYLGKDLSGKKLLKIGPGEGRMSSLFAILGAEVTALDLDPGRIEATQKMINNFRVENNVETVLYDGDLASLAGRKFDILFSKSALIYPQPLDKYLIGLNSLLNDDGRFVFIENGQGNFLVHIYRILKRRSISFFRRTHFFTQDEIDLIRTIFKVELQMHSRIPPIYLICGKKK